MSYWPPQLLQWHVGHPLYPDCSSLDKSRASSLDKTRASRLDKTKASSLDKNNYLGEKYNLKLKESWFKKKNLNLIIAAKVWFYIKYRFKLKFNIPL